MATLTDRDNGGRVSVRVGEFVELRLAENATAGYRWTLERYDAALLEPLDAAADYDDRAVGSGGQAIFRFRVRGAGSTELALKYWRHWEGEGSILQRFTITLDSAR